MSKKNIFILVIIIGSLFTDCGALAKQNVAIIGGGLGASMVLSNLEADLKNNDLEVTVFEKSDHLGGRVETLIYENNAIELGKDRISRSDKLMKEFIEKAKAKFAPTNLLSVGIFNGEGFDFLLGSSFFVRPLQFILTFPISTILLLIDYMSYCKKFDTIFDFASKRSYKRFGDLLLDADIADFMDYAYDDYFTSSYFGIGGSIARSYLRALSVLSFNQNEKINAFAGYQSLFLGSSSLLEVTGGLQALLTNTIMKSPRTHVKLNTGIESIEKLRDKQKYRLRFNGTQEVDFDKVIIAFPLLADGSFAKFFSGFNADFLQDIHAVVYESLHVTIVKSQGISEKWIRLNETATYQPRVLVPSESMKTLFYKIENVCEKCLKNSASVFRISSKEKLEEIEVFQFFEKKAEIIAEKHWESMFPYLRPLDTSDLLDYELDAGLYYLHAAESIAPTMSVESISSKIVANLVRPSFQPEIVHSMHDDEDL